MSAEWFAVRLRELRTEAGLTQGQLAERAGVQRDAVARWERGTREPSWSNEIALADALAVSTEAFRQEPKPAPAPPRGRPRKEQGVQLDLHATESAPLESAPGPTPTRKGRAGRLPRAQDKPKGR
jgi:transcriptional regulator with XRE-family HTH domain